jgi:hypothetical protein
MNWTHEIATCPRVQKYSQNGEEGPLLFILEKLGLLDQKDMLVVDFGAGDGRDLSNSRLLIEMGWHGRLIDIDPRGAKDVIADRVTMNNARGYAIGCNVLLVDIDSNDLWVMKAALSGSSPAVVVCEINTRFEREESYAMPYIPDFEWSGSGYFGMSLEAAIRIGKAYGYSPVHVHCNYNLFMVRNDLLPQGPLPELIYGKFVGFTEPTPEQEWIEIR